MAAYNHKYATAGNIHEFVSSHDFVYARAAGFSKLQNLTGGMHAWSDEVDPSVPKY